MLNQEVVLDTLSEQPVSFWYRLSKASAIFLGCGMALMRQLF